MAFWNRATSARIAQLLFFDSSPTMTRATSARWCRAIVFFLFDSNDFVEAALVAASGEGCVEESLDHFEGSGGGDDAGA